MSRHEVGRSFWLHNSWRKDDSSDSGGIKLELDDPGSSLYKLCSNIAGYLVLLPPWSGKCSTFNVGVSYPLLSSSFKIPRNLGFLFEGEVVGKSPARFSDIEL